MRDDLLALLRTSPVVGRYFDVDGQLVVVSGGSEDGDGGQGDGGDEGEGQGSGEGGDGGGDEFTPPQSKADLDALVKAQVEEQIGAQAAKREKALRSKIEKEHAEKAERAKMDEAERAKAEKADAEQAANEKVTAANARLIKAEAKAAAHAAGVKADRVARFLRNVDLDDTDLIDDDGNLDEDAISAAVASALDDVPEFKGNTATGASSTEFNGSDRAPAQLTRADLKGMSPQEITTAKKEGKLKVLLGQ